MTMAGTLRLLGILLACALAPPLSPVADAQEGPAGNTHPERMVPSDRPAVSPFGNAEPERVDPGEAARSRANLAASVDLSPLRDLAVFHNGRVKILDTLAREAVETITGRTSFSELVPTGEGDGRDKRSYDPLFTHLDLSIQSSTYAGAPLVHVEYLPLRRAFVNQMTEEATERERWMKTTRLPPGAVAALLRPVAERFGTEAEMARGLGRAREALLMIQHAEAALRLVAPDSPSGEWATLSALPPEHPARDAAMRFGGAWRLGDADGVNQAALDLAAILPTINAEQYPTTQRTLEAAYNASNPFEWGYWIYAVSLLSLILAFGTGRRWLTGVGLGTLALGAGLHAFGFGARWMIAERLPIQNQFESMTGLALGGVLVGLALLAAKRQTLFGAAAAGVGFLTLLTATQTDIPGASIGREAAILNTSWLLKYHVSIVLLSYGLITLAFLISLFYLGVHYATKSARDAQNADPVRIAAEGLGLTGAANRGPTRILSDLDTAQMTVLQLAFWTLGVGVLLGAWWADHSWGRWWAFDPKETWALLTWIVYLVIIHVRFATGAKRGLVTAWLSVFGFLVMLWTYFGVNLLLPGLHAYA